MRGLIACAERGAPGEAYNLASGVETSILDLARTDQRTDRQPDADRAGAGARLGPLGPPFRRSRARRSEQLGFVADNAAARRARRDDRLDPRQPRHDPPLHAAACALCAGAARGARHEAVSRILTVVGARPQFVKAAAISRAIAARGDIEEILLHTGQHFDAAMSQVFFDELGHRRAARSISTSTAAVTAR